MAAFSYQSQPFIDCVFLPENSIKMPGFEEQIDSFCFSHYTFGFPEQISDKIHETRDSDSSSEVFGHGGEMGGVGTGEFVKKWNNGGGIISGQGPDCSVFEVECADQVVQRGLMEKKRKDCNGYRLNSAQNRESKEHKAKKGKTEKKTKNEKNKQRKICEEPPNSYVHVRARRGQATDRHSLAERVRREKIGERMKLLQDLVPGCDKITSKALLLDEIINYVQSLQNQVEFLSTKLASVNPMFYDFSLDFEDCMIKSEQSSETQLKLEYEQGPTFANQTAFPATTNYPLLDTTVSILIDNQLPNALSQDNGNLSWNVEDLMLSFIDQEGFNKLVSKGTETLHDQDQHSQSQKRK